MRLENMANSSFSDTSYSRSFCPSNADIFAWGSDHVSDQIYVDETPVRECSVKRPFAVGKYPVIFENLLPFLADVPAQSDLGTTLSSSQRSRVGIRLSRWHRDRVSLG